MVFYREDHNSLTTFWIYILIGFKMYEYTDYVFFPKTVFKIVLSLSQIRIL